MTIIGIGDQYLTFGIIHSGSWAGPVPWAMFGLISMRAEGRSGWKALVLGSVCPMVECQGELRSLLGHSRMHRAAEGLVWSSEPWPVESALKPAGLWWGWFSTVFLHIILKNYKFKVTFFEWGSPGKGLIVSWNCLTSLRHLCSAGINRSEMGNRCDSQINLDTKMHVACIHSTDVEVMGLTWGKCCLIMLQSPLVNARKLVNLEKETIVERTLERI